MSTFWIVVLVIVILALMPFIIQGLVMLIGLLISAGAMVIGLMFAVSVGIYVLLSTFFDRIYKRYIRR